MGKVLCLVGFSWLHSSRVSRGISEIEYKTPQTLYVASATTKQTSHVFGEALPSMAHGHIIQIERLNSC
eukprot:1425792-Amphidinium_carterae.1